MSKPKTYRVKPRRRWLWMRPLDMLLTLIPTPRRKKGMLVVRGLGIGDSILFKPAFNHYAEAFGVNPEDITLLGSHSWSGAAEIFYPGVKKHFIDHRLFERSAWYRIKFVWWLRRQGFKIATLDMWVRKPIIFDAVVALSGAERRFATNPRPSSKIAYEQNFYAKQMTRMIDTLQGNNFRFCILQHFEFITQATGKVFPPRLPHMKKNDFARPNIPTPYTVLNFGSSEPARCWPLDHFIRLAEDLSALGKYVVFIGGPSEVDKAPLLEQHFEDNARVINMVGKQSILEMCGALAHAELVVTNDTGPAHISIACGTKTVVICGGGDFNWFVPYDKSLAPSHAIFVNHAMPCYQCYWDCYMRKNGEKYFPCLSQIAYDRVYQAARNLQALHVYAASA